MTTFARSSLLAVALSSVAACAAPAGSQSAPTDDQSFTSEHTGKDITVLQAWIGDTIGQRYANGYQLGDHALDLSRCSGQDCTAAAQSVLDSQLVGAFPYDAERSGQCETIEIRTVVRETTFDAPTFSGIGFYLSTIRGQAFVSKASLVAHGDSGHVKLADGAQAVVHRFVAQGMCFGLGGNGGSIDSRSYDLKPYVQFDADGNSYKVWDNVAADFQLGRNRAGGFVKSFDRQGELLAH